MARVLTALLLLAAARALGHGDPADEVARLDRELETMPSADGFLRRAELLRNCRRFDEALDDAGRAKARGATATQVELARGQTLADAGRSREALAALDAYLLAGGGSPVALTLRARLLDEAGRGAEAVIDLARAMAAAPTPERCLALAELQRRLGREDDARSTLESGLRRLGGAVTVRAALIDLERGARRYDAALAQVREAMARLPIKAEWRLKAAELLLEARRAPEARAELLLAGAELDDALAHRHSSLHQAARQRVSELLDLAAVAKQPAPRRGR